jgi:hypothetical protein
VPIVIVDPSVAAAGSDTGGDGGGMSAGAIAGLVILLVLLLVALVSLMLYLQNKRSKEDAVVNALVTPNITGIESVSNPMYGSWFQPDMSKEDAYAALGPEGPGSFYVRQANTAVGGVANPTYALHVKNVRNVIQDEIISKGDNGLSFVSGGSAAPSFQTLPELVRHYESNRGMDFVLASDRTLRNAVYASSEPVYDNAAVKNIRVRTNSDAPLPLKAAERDAVKKLAESGGELYLNNKEANQALSL